jgi:hypothetical protein
LWLWLAVAAAVLLILGVGGWLLSSRLERPVPSESSLPFKFWITGRGRPGEDLRLTLQLCLKSGETLETGAGRKILLGKERLELSDLGGWIRHHGWTLRAGPSARLVWPFYPYHPYTAKPETGLDHAVGALSVPLQLTPRSGSYVRPREQEIPFVLEVGAGGADRQ